MQKEKLTNLIEGLILMVLGIFIAIFGGGQVVDVYFGIVSLVTGLVFGIMALMEVTNKRPLPLKPVVLCGAFVSVAIGLFVGWLSFAQLINLLILIILGCGAGLVIYGIYLMAKKKTSLGVTIFILGVFLVVLPVLYMLIPDFRKAFWIIVGIIIALEGLLQVASALIKEKKKK